MTGAALMMVLTVVIGLVFFWIDGDFVSPFPDFYLIPWSILTAFLIISPWLYWIYRKEFSLINPVVYAGWLYFLPAFVGGGFILAGGWNHAYFLNYIENPEYNLPLCLVYVSIAYLGLAFGFMLPFGKVIGEYVKGRLPRWDWTEKELLMPSLGLLGIGIFFNLSALVSGLLGFQRLNEIGVFDALQYFLTLIFVEANFLLWMIIFKTRNRDWSTYALSGFLVLLIPFRMIILGSRSSLLQAVIMILVAFTLSGRKLRFQQAAIVLSLGVLALFAGVIYGTTFRNIKGSESKVSVEEFADSVGQTFNKLGTDDLSKTMSEAVSSLAERVDALSSLGVVVANYEKLAPYEAAYGLENNIWTYTWTAFVPRILYADKPVVSDARGYSDLYFDFGENSFAITVIGDLLRNYGPIGIPLGMILLGFVLRIFYAALVENNSPSSWQAMIFYMVLITVSYEAFYGTILPLLLRVGLVVFVSIIFLRIVIGKPRV